MARRITWLVIDGDYVCHLAYYAMGHLATTSEDVGRGVIFGFFNYLTYYVKKFGTANVIFCFDHGEPLRRQVYPKYKVKDEEPPGNVHCLADRLKTEYLPELGFKNVFYRDGYEADDMVALYSNHCSVTETGDRIIISEDQDFYQLLSDRVDIYKPRSRALYTMQDLYAKYKILPCQWATVKAIAGCVSDKIPGVYGVGEITAAKYVRCQLSHRTLAHKNITSNWPLVQRNINLIKLPYPGLTGKPRLVPVRDEVTEKKWNDFCRRMNMKSLVGQPPIPQRLQRRLF